MTTYTFEKEKDMEKGFKDFLGNIWTDSEVSLYNSYTALINQNAGKVITMGSERHNEIEYYRDGRHKLFQMVHLMRKDGKKIGH